MERQRKKNLITYKEALVIYPFGKTKMREIAAASGAIIKIGYMVILDMDKIDAYLETFRVDPEWK